MTSATASLLHIGLPAAVTSRATSQPRVEQVAHRVAEHVQTVHDNCQAEAGPQSQPRRHLHVLAPLPAEHAAPNWESGAADRSRGSSETPSVMITAPMLMLKMTIIGAAILGSTWRTSVFHVAEPIHLRGLKVGILLDPEHSPSHHA